MQRGRTALGQPRHRARAGHQEGDAAIVRQWLLRRRHLLPRLWVAAGEHAVAARPVAECDARRHGAAVLWSAVDHEGGAAFVNRRDVSEHDSATRLRLR